MGYIVILDRWVTLSALCKESKVPWKGCNVMEERLKFVARLLDGEARASLRHRDQAGGRPAKARISGAGVTWACGLQKAGSIAR